MNGTATQIEMCGETLKIGDWVKVRYTTGKWRKAMEANKLMGVLEKHAKWRRNEEGGEKADLRGADLSEANIDFSCWPLWCGSKNVKVDAQIARQLAAHFCVLDCDNAEYQAARAAILEFAKKSHISANLGLVNGDTEK